MSASYSPRESLELDETHDSLPGEETLWARYLSLSEKSDDQFVNDLKGVSDGILVFTGLFAAVVAQFLAQTYTLLTQDPNDQSTTILTQISQQLAGETVSVRPQLDFVAPPYAIRLNSLWFLSLLLSIFAAFMATLIQQWARTYQRDVQGTGSLAERGLLHSCLYAGIKRSGLTYSVDLVVIILNAAVVLFGIGLAELAGSLNSVVSDVVVITLYVFLGVYGSMSIVPVFVPECPYATPLTPVFRIFAAGVSYLFCLSYAEQLANLLKIDIYSITGAVFQTVLSRCQQLNIQSRLHSSFRFEHVAGRLIQNLRTATDVRRFFATLPYLLDSPLMRERQWDAWRILFRQKLHYALAWLLLYTRKNDAPIKDEHMETLCSFSHELTTHSERADSGIYQLSVAWTIRSADASPHTILVAQCALASMRAQFCAYPNPAHVTRQTNVVTGRKVRVFHPDGDVAQRHIGTRTELFSLANLGLGAMETPHPEEHNACAQAHLPSYAFISLLQGAARASRNMPALSSELRTMCIEVAQRLVDFILAGLVPSPRSAARIRLNALLDAANISTGGDDQQSLSSIVRKRSTSVENSADGDALGALLQRIPELRTALQQVATFLRDAGLARQGVRAPVSRPRGFWMRIAEDARRFSPRVSTGSAIGGIPLLPTSGVISRPGDVLDV